MDIQAFGSMYPQVSPLPYASGFVWVPDDGEKTFSTCRAILVRASSNASNVYVVLNDAQGQQLNIAGFSSNPLFTGAATSISGGNITQAVVLF